MDATGFTTLNDGRKLPVSVEDRICVELGEITVDASSRVHCPRLSTGHPWLGQRIEKRNTEPFVFAKVRTRWTSNGDFRTRSRRASPSNSFANTVLVEITGNSRRIPVHETGSGSRSVYEYRESARIGEKLHRGGRCFPMPNRYRTTGIRVHALSCSFSHHHHHHRHHRHHPRDIPVRPTNLSHGPYKAPRFNSKRFRGAIDAKLCA